MLVVVLGTAGFVCLAVLLLWASLRRPERAPLHVPAPTSRENALDAVLDRPPASDGIPVPPADLSAYATVGIAALQDWLESQPPRR